MVDIPNEIQELGFHVQKEPESIEKTVYNNLMIIHRQSKRLLESYECYCKCDDERLKDDLLESINSRINHISQAFRDIMAFIEITEQGAVYEESLRYYVRQYFKRGITWHRFFQPRLSNRCAVLPAKYSQNPERFTPLGSFYVLMLPQMSLSPSSPESPSQSHCMPSCSACKKTVLQPLRSRGSPEP